MKPGAYDYREIEKYWRTRWLEEKPYRTAAPGDEGYDAGKPKCYVLDMFPYTSGDGLHIGHPKGYIASDIYSRYKRMQGYTVLHPMGFDSFGLPAEQYAIQHNVHPAASTEQCINRIREQLQFLGLSYDWDREIATSQEDYYGWTQWIFLQLHGSWFDPQAKWTDQAGHQGTGKARPVDELVAALDAGERQLSDDDRQSLEAVPGAAGHRSGWSDLDTAEREAILNNYRLAYQKEVTVNWCPGLGTVLANEEVTNEGKSERGDFPVYKRPLKQWMLRITDYADRLLADLDRDDLPDGRGGAYCLDWPDAIKLMQQNWIGRSEGAEVTFDVLRPGAHDILMALEVFTTRPDTLFGATFMVVAPEHPLVSPGSESYAVPEEWPDGIAREWQGEGGEPAAREAVAAYVSTAAQVRTGPGEDEKEKTGVFTGIYARNPVSGNTIPIFVADYVSMDYGTGAIMAVPAHDDRDFEFARRYGLDVPQVVQPPLGSEDECFTGDGVSINSPAQGESPFAITGLETAAAKVKITAALTARGVGRAAVSYRLRDWVFSRQRYWGEPFPLATHPDGYAVATELPVSLPEMEDFRPQTSEDPDTPVQPPLSRADRGWIEVAVGGVPCRRELNVMPQWAGSCWYYLRFIDPHNDQAFCAPEKERSFMPVDLYIGGAEHAVLHLLYARFWHKVLFDLGHVSSPEPFTKLRNQGMITADAFADDRGVYVDIREVELRGETPVHTKTGKELHRFAGKMGKRYKNGLPPEEVGEEYGVDTLRLYEMYMGPLDHSAPWSMEGIRGMQRFLQRVWRNLVAQDGSSKVGGDLSDELARLLHRTIAKVTEDIEGLRLNTSIASIIELNNELVGREQLPEQVAGDLLRLLAPLAPHMAEELWRRCGFGDGDLHAQAWPVHREELVADEMITLPIQVNGKVRCSIDVPVDIEEQALREKVLALENVQRFIPDPAAIKRFILVPGRIVNIVV
ncbi:leucine--tRNA ligase [Candidatus Latescibacterota bacterium]